MSSGARPDGDRVPWRRVAREIDLPWPTAVWVLGIHVVTILSPLVVVAAVAAHRAHLDTVLDRPELLYAYALLLLVASICESAQNTADRWYLTGVPPSLLDLLFNALVALALAVSVLAVWGDDAWVWVLVLAVWAVFPVAYLLGRPVAPVQAVLGLASAVALYVATDEPVVLLTLPPVFLTLYFLDLLVRTRQQVFHGLTTGVNVLGVLAVAAALAWSGSADGWGWTVVVVVAVIAVAVPLAVRPALLRVGPTPRREDADRLRVGGPSPS